MRISSIIIIVLFFSTLGYSQNSERKKLIIKNFKIDSIEQILILDSYNDNFEREWGRKYLVEPKDEGYEIFKTEEYYKNYEFDENKVEFDSLILLKNVGISKSKAKKLTKEVNERSRQRVFINEKMDSLAWGTSKKPENWNGKKSLGSIDKKYIEKFISTLNSKRNSPYKYLMDNGIDSLWLNKNYDRLYGKWQELYPSAKKSSKKDISTALKDFSIFKRSFFSNLVRGGFTSYPYFEIIIINKNLDSTKLTSRGQSHFQIPWILENRKIYNPHLSVSISNLVPEEKFYSINKRLNPNWSEIEKAVLWDLLKVYRSEQRRKK